MTGSEIAEGVCRTLMPIIYGAAIGACIGFFIGLFAFWLVS